MNLIRVYSEFDEAMFEALDMSRGLPSGMGLKGYGVAHLMDGDGKTKLLVPFANLITTFGDQYYSTRGVAGIGTPNIGQPTLADGMKLGTATTAVHKSTAGGANIATGGYIAGSNNLFDTTHPQVSAVGGDGGWNATYKTTWAAGDATNATINECAIVTDQETDSGSAVGTTISRAVITTVNKQAADTLAITWNHKFLGAP